MTTGAIPTLEAFIARWLGREGGQERANYQLFLSELCDAIGVKRPDPAGTKSELNDYVFERVVREPQGDGTYANRRIDESTFISVAPSFWRPSRAAKSRATRKLEFRATCLAPTRDQPGGVAAPNGRGTSS